MPPRLSLEHFVLAAATDPDRGVLVAINCYHLVGNQLGNEIHGVTFEAGRVWDPKTGSKAVAEVIRGKAEVFAQDLPGVQTFKVQAYYEGSGQEPKGFYHFNVSSLAEFPNGMTEDATPRGLTQQGMRWGEAIVQRTFGMQQLLFEHQQALTRDLREDRDEYRREARESFGIIRELLQERITSQHEMRMNELRFQRETEERKKLITFLPAMINTVMGRKVFDLNAADTATVESVAMHVAKMSDEDRAKLFQQLPPELSAALLPRISEIVTRQAREASGENLLKEGKKEDTKAALESEPWPETPSAPLGNGQAVKALGTGDTH